MCVNCSFKHIVGIAIAVYFCTNALQSQWFAYYSIYHSNFKYATSCLPDVAILIARSIFQSHSWINSTILLSPSVTDMPSRSYSLATGKGNFLITKRQKFKFNQSFKRREIHVDTHFVISSEIREMKRFPREGGGRREENAWDWIRNQVYTSKTPATMRRTFFNIPERGLLYTEYEKAFKYKCRAELRGFFYFIFSL